MRGTLVASLQPCGERGIIPAYAGNTCGFSTRFSNHWDHPRICGEHRPTSPISWTRPGSSPHMRGTLDRTQRHTAIPGIIPAYAGNTGSLKMRLPLDGDHPRICGEHVSEITGTTGEGGSSPHMRGTLEVVVVGGGVIGIIPAYAGNTNGYVARILFFRDHPRICGEHHVNNNGIGTVAGSSPHMRGTPIYIPAPCQSRRIIPAYAGNTCHIICGNVNGGDHPRICGEHTKRL